ncbi:MAG: tetratricopeptide repeat protein [Longimicrobiaceae bacterium]
MSKGPVIQQVAQLSVIPQTVAWVGIAVLLMILTGIPALPAWGIGALIYTAYAIGIRAIIARAHRAGIARVKAGDYGGAIPCFEESYTFFSRRPWLDRWRYLLLGSSSAASYREMALVNIAFSYAQIGERERCRTYYERAAAEFPDSALAQGGLMMVRSFGSQETTREA